MDPRFVGIACYRYARQILRTVHMNDGPVPAAKLMVDWVQGRDEPHLALEALQVAVESRMGGGTMASVLTIADEAYSFATSLKASEGQPSETSSRPVRKKARRKKARAASKPRRSATQD